jgi:hypothetical protein
VTSFDSQQFAEWRSPRFGRLNPERMNNPVWERLIRSGAYSANDEVPAGPAENCGPAWSFSRYGQSSTVLADGRTVRVAGEHEDSYHPDFFIYNDVVVTHPDDRIDIFGYSRETFPPTDFHTATLTQTDIVIVGRLGYLHERQPGHTPVLLLDLGTFEISPVVTSGDPPGWLHGHESVLSRDEASIVISKGKIDCGGLLIENVDDWLLDLSEWKWHRLTERRWPRFVVRRRDGKPNHLFEIRQAEWASAWGSPAKFERAMAELSKKLGRQPEFEVLGQLYRPSIPHEVLSPAEDEFRAFRINVDGVLVRYVESFFSIHITVEGDLPGQVLDSLTTDLLGKLAALENASVVMDTFC